MDKKRIEFKKNLFNAINKYLDCELPDTTKLELYWEGGNLPKIKLGDLLPITKEGKK